jgi:hypothetical protein
VLADEQSPIRSDPVPGLSVDKLGAFQVEIAVPRSELRIGVRSVDGRAEISAIPDPGSASQGLSDSVRRPVGPT